MTGLFFACESMRVSDVEHMLEQWAPRGAAWDKDNVGLQVGDPSRRVKRILVALDANEDVIDEARRKKVDLIVTHHPLLFRPPKSLSPNERVGKMVFRLVQDDIALYSAHTNLDFTSGGVSFALAERLGLRNVTFLQGHRDELRKVVVFVPREEVQKVSDAMAAAGAGVIGQYDHCSFRLEGSGTFRGGAKARPFRGSTGRLETVREIRLEMIVPKWKADDVIRAMKSAHPYEEVAYDLYTLENVSANHGAGAVGSLPKPMVLKKLLGVIKEELDVPMLRFSGDARARVHTVAVCGGSGSELLETAVLCGADAFVTADVKYHMFEAARGRIALIDAGHFETEEPSLDKVVAYLRDQLAARRDKVQIVKTSCMTNPIQYY